MPDRAYWQRRAFAAWNEHVALPREDRLDYVGRVFNRDVHSWAQLTDAEMIEVAVLLSIKRVQKSLEALAELRLQRGNVSRPYGGGVDAHSVRNGEHPPGRGVADVDGDRTNPRPGSSVGVAS